MVHFATGLQGVKGDTGNTGQQGPAGPAGGPATLSGSVTFVDPADLTGFSGIGGQQNVAATVTDAGSVIGSGGTISAFRGQLTFPMGAVTFSLFVNGVATSLTCTVLAPGSACTDALHTVTLAAGDVIAVRIANASSNPLRHVSWSAKFA